MTSRFSAFASVASVVIPACLVFTGCAADRAASPVYSPTPAAPGYPEASSGAAYADAPASTRDSSNVAATTTEHGPTAASPPPAPAKRGIFGGSGGDKEKDEAKKVAFAEPSAPAPPPPAQPPQAGQPSALLKADPTKEPAQSRDLVIYTARFTMAVYQVDQGLAAVEKVARDNNGYLAQKKDREITIRIPRGRFEPTLSAIDKIGDVLHREIQAEDVTDEHVDLEIRIKNARAMQKRLSDLLTKASVKDALEIEKELHRVTEELERLEGRMKVLKDKVAFSTITVAFEPRGASIQTARVRLPFPWLGGLNLPSLLSLSEDK